MRIATADLGLWNIYYYPALDQLISFIGGLFVVAANALWLAMMVYFSRRTDNG